MTLDLDAHLKLAEAAKERAEKATEGPWERWEDHGSVKLGPMEVNEPSHCSPVDEDGWEVVVQDDENEIQVDAEFIAHARTDVPALADSVKVLVAEVKRLQKRSEALSLRLKTHRQECGE